MLKEMYAYCKEHIRMFDAKADIALDLMDEMRCPFEHASHLYDEMEEKIEEFCIDNDLDYYAMLDEDPDLVEHVFMYGPEE